MVQTPTDNFAAVQDDLDLLPVFVLAVEGYITTTLDGDITADALAINLTDASGFPTSGVLEIDGEYIYYSSKGAAGGGGYGIQPYGTSSYGGGTGNTINIPDRLGRGSLASTAAAHSGGDTVRVVYVFSSAPVAGRESNTSWRQVLDPPKGLTQKIEVEEGRSEFGAINFATLDIANAITGILADNSIAFRNRIMRFLVGYRDIPEADYLLKHNLRCRDVNLDNTLQRYVWKGIDIQRTLKERVIFGRSDLDGAITDTVPGIGGTLTVNGPIENFAAVGHLRIDDEVIAYSAKSGTTGFVVSARGDEGTTAAAHSDDTEANEIYIVQDNPIDTLLRFLLTDAGDGTNSKYDINDTTKGLAVDEGLVDIAAFEKARDDYFLSRTYKFQFTADDLEDFIDWAESQINKTLPGTFVIRGDGRLSFKAAAPILPINDSFEIDEGNIQGFPKWDLGAKNVINDIRISYDYDLVADKYLKTQVNINADSQAKHGEGPKLVIESKGIQTSLDAQAVIDRIIQFFDQRFSEPTPEVKAKIRWKDINMETADGVLLSHEQLPDLDTGRRGLISLPMEVSQKTEDYKSGMIEVTLRDINRVGKYAVIAPDNSLETPANDFPDYQSASARERNYAYICDTSSGLMLNGDPPSLIV